jgi:hypothetical protein
MPCSERALWQTAGRLISVLFFPMVLRLGWRSHFPLVPGLWHLDIITFWGTRITRRSSVLIIIVIIIDPQTKSRTVSLKSRLPFALSDLRLTPQKFARSFIGTVVAVLPHVWALNNSLSYTVYVPYILSYCHNKQSLFLYTALTDLSLWWKRNLCFLWGGNCICKLYLNELGVREFYCPDVSMFSVLNLKAIHAI